jgi:HSP20 family molecular chaperone IbpA
MKTQTALDAPDTGTAVAKQPHTGSIFEHLNNAYEAIANRAFELFERRGHQHGHDLEDWLRAEEELFLAVPVEITQDEKQSIVKAEIPGFEKKDIKVTVEGNQLLISGTKSKSEGDGSSFKSESREEFFRVVDLPSETDPAKVEAKLDKNTLTITLPKQAAAAAAGANIAIK